MSRSYGSVLTLTHRLTGGCLHIVGNLSAEDEPSILGIVDEYVTVALDFLNNLVTTHLPGINRVKLTPLKENVNTLEHLGNACCTPIGAPSYINVKTNSRNVALDVIKRLKIRRVIGSAKISNSGIGAIL